MRTTVRTYGLTTDGTVLDSLDYRMGTVTVIQRAHDLKVHLAAVGTGGLVHYIVAGVTLIPSLFHREIVK